MPTTLPKPRKIDHIQYTIRGYTRLGDVMTRALLETYEGPILGLPTPAMPIASYVGAPSPGLTA